MYSNTVSMAVIAIYATVLSTVIRFSMKSCTPMFANHLSAKCSRAARARRVTRIVRISGLSLSRKKEHPTF